MGTSGGASGHPRTSTDRRAVVYQAKGLDRKAPIPIARRIRAYKSTMFQVNKFPYIVIISQIFRIFVFTKTTQNLFLMSVKVYVISDPLAINFLVDDDIYGFKEYLDSDDMLDFPEPEVFDTEAETLAFCAGIGYGSDERAMPDRYPLRSCEPADAPFIEAIEAY